MATKKITPVAMTIEQYEKYLDFIDKYGDNSEEARGEAKFYFALTKWTATEVYGIDLKSTAMTPGTITSLWRKTVELTEKDELEDLKN